MENKEVVYNFTGKSLDTGITISFDAFIHGNFLDEKSITLEFVKREDSDNIVDVDFDKSK